MGGSHETDAGRTLFQAGQLIEDATLAIVEQQDAEIALEIRIPQGVLIVEETEVADDTKDVLVCHDREAGGCRQRTLDAVDATITPDMMVGVDIGQTNG